MVLARTNDSTVEGFSPSTQLRFLYADVSEAATRLAESNHLSQVAANAFAKLLAGVGLLSFDTGAEGETVCVSIEFDGPLAGFYAEVDDKGHIRGTVSEKRPETLLRFGEENPDDIFGNSARMKVTRIADADGVVRAQMAFRSSPGTPEKLFSDFFHASLPTRLALSSATFSSGIERVRALAVQRVPSSDADQFERVCGLFADGTIAEQLSSDCTLPALRDVLDLPDLCTGPTRAIAFGCTCSEEKVLSSWAKLSRTTLEAILRSPSERTFRCHMCGREITLPVEKILPLLKNKKGKTK